ncbi:unnamed protein product [Rotaria magnacalcarata]|uniref:Uncharacterized protein n=1 Tax=Rotaria magnacalcarata TaxID=392030 RepID=A0A818YTP5_9BILA|nr:unnamed protein product [Rotaria magnacalcarata]CAF3983219.1 unnamed protein product [Rotaria magnacalcarata]
MIPLRIIVLYNYSRCQVDSISSHLTFHAHQIISIKIYDKLRDYTSATDLLFRRRYFTNLESCELVANSSPTKLENVIKQINTLNKLVSFSICAPNDETISRIDKYALTRIMLIHKSARSIQLSYRYDYMDISNYTLIPSNLISLKLSISDSSSTVSVYSVLSILRLVNYSNVSNKKSLKREKPIKNKMFLVYFTASIPAVTINENDLPVLSHVISFDLGIIARYDARSIGYILCCMPNLRQLSKSIPRLNLDIVVNSFEYFVEKNLTWNINIDRWKFYCQRREEFLILQIFNYRKHIPNLCMNIPFIYGESFATQSTAPNTHHLFYSDIENLRVFITNKMSILTWSSARFQQIKQLTVEMPIIRTSL